MKHELFYGPKRKQLSDLRHLLAVKSRLVLAPSLSTLEAPNVEFTSQFSHWATVGVAIFGEQSAHLFFLVIAKRYESGRSIQASSRAVGEWGDVFSDSVLATAILDRVLHHSKVFVIRGELPFERKTKRRTDPLSPIRGNNVGKDDSVCVSQ